MIDHGGSYQFSFNALNKAATSLLVTEVDPAAPYGETQLYLRGNMNEWGTNNNFRYLGNYQYQLAIALEVGSYTFKVSDANWSAETNFGGNNVALGLEQSKTLLVSGGNISLDISDSGDYLLMLNAFEPQSPQLSLTSFTPAFIERDISLRGSMNNWGSEQVFSYQGGGRYSTRVTLAEQEYQFKIADADWAEVNLGADDGNMALALGKALSSGQGDLTLSITTPGNYDFELDVLAAELPVLTITKTPALNCVFPDSELVGPLAGIALFVRGDLSDWQPLADYQLRYKGNNRYQVKLNHPGEINFKLADNSNDWQLQYFVGEPNYWKVGGEVSFRFLVWVRARVKERYSSSCYVTMDEAS